MSIRIIVCLVISGIGAAFGSEAAESAAPVKDNPELQMLFSEDQADRSPTTMKDRSWEEISIRDEKRELRVKALIAEGALNTGPDYYHAAMVLQHAPRPDDYLLAHDLCVIAISKGEDRAKWLSAASLDRFLINIGRPQRYGTQFRSYRPNQPPRLVEVDPSVPDSLRRELNVPSLEEASSRERDMIKDFEANQKPAR